MSVVNTETVVMMGAALAAAGNVQGQEAGIRNRGKTVKRCGGAYSGNGAFAGGTESAVSG